MILALACVIVMLMTLSLLRSLNLKREQRWQQTAFLWALAAGDLLCVICVQLFADTALPQWLSMIPASLKTPVSQEWHEILFSNALSGLVLLAVKALIRVINPNSGKARPAPWAERWYRSDGSIVRPTDPASGLRRWAFMLLALSIPVICAVAALSFRLPAVFPASSLKWWPVLWLATALEIFWFANGSAAVKRQETPSPKERPDSDEADYEKTFPEWFVCRVDGNKTAGSRGNGQKIRIADRIRDIVEQPNVLIDAVLESDLGDELIGYLDIMMDRGDNVLVLALDSMEAEKKADYIRGVLKKRHDGEMVRIIRSPRDITQNGDCDLAVLTVQQVLELRLGVQEHSFTKDLKHLVVPDTAQILSWQSDLLATAVRLLKTHCPLQRTFFLSSTIPLQLATVISAILDVKIEALKVVDVESYDRPQTVYLWRKENIVNNALPIGKLTDVSVQAHDFDLHVPLAVKAYRLGRVPIRVISERFPLTQIVQAIRMAAGAFRKIVPVDRLVSELENDEDQSETVILEDEDCLLAAALIRAGKYAADGGDIHLISRPYMLREYFMSEFSRRPDDFIRSRTYADQLSSSFTDSAYTVAVQIMIEASMPGGIAEKRLRRLVRPYLPSDAALKDILCWCGRLVFRKQYYDSPENDFETRIRDDDYHPDGGYRHETTIHVKNPAVLDDLQHSRLKRAKLSVGGSDRPANLRFSADSIRHRLIESQGLLYDGTVYQVTGIDDKSGLIKAEPATEDMRDAVDFVQTRIYRLTGKLTPDGDAINLVNRLTVQSYRCDGIEVGIPGYYVLPQDAREPQLLNGDAMTYRILEKPRRRTLHSTHLVQLGIWWPDNGADMTGPSVFLAILMNELFRTYFPSDWPCIAACPLIAESAGAAGEAADLWKKLSGYYPSLAAAAAAGMKLPANYAGVVILEDSENADGRLLRALLGSIQRPFEMPLTVLADYLTWLGKASGLKSYYLAFGGESVPSCFDLTAMQAALSRLYGT